MTIGERIKEQREKRGFSQVSFADALNVSKQTLFKYENNLITNIPSDKIEAAASLLGVRPGYLMGWEELEKTEPEQDYNFERPNTLAAHFEGEEFSEAEMAEIKNFVEFVKAKRK